MWTFLDSVCSSKSNCNNRGISLSGLAYSCNTYSDVKFTQSHARRQGSKTNQTLLILCGNLLIHCNVHKAQRELVVQQKYSWVARLCSSRPSLITHLKATAHLLFPIDNRLADMHRYTFMNAQCSSIIEA